MPIEVYDVEMGVQCVMRQRSVNAGFQPEIEKQMVDKLIAAGCLPESIELPEAEWRLFSPDPDFGQTWTPYWAWQLDGFGFRKADGSRN